MVNIEPKPIVQEDFWPGLYNRLFNVGPLAKWKANAIKSLDSWQSGGKIAEAKKWIVKAIEREDLEYNYLILSGLNLNSLPPVVWELTSLKSLNLENNSFESLPSEIGKLTNLERLHLRNNVLKTLTPEIGKLVSLKKLKLRYNKLKALPSEIGKLILLEKLHASYNLIESLPSEIGGLTSLQRLSLKTNRLKTLPSEVGKLTKLMKLKASTNGLSALPTEIGKLTSLVVLDLMCNMLGILPSEIGALTNLKDLDIRGAGIQSLPPEIGLCKKIQALRISHNMKLSELPMSLGQIPNLTDLIIDKTDISVTSRDAILDQCCLLRCEGAIWELPGRLNTWKAIAKSHVDLSGIEGFSQMKKIDLNEWLLRLEKTRDFSKSQAKLAAIVCNMLLSVCENPEFGTLFFDQVAVNNERCEDRAAMSLNEIYTSWNVLCISENSSIKEKLKIMSGAAKTLALRCEIAKSIFHNEPESVEIYLYYETRLRKQLDLCTAIERMEYSQIGWRDHINTETLVKTVNETFFTHLLDLPVFDRLVKRELNSEWERIQSRAQIELSDLGECPAGNDLAEGVLAWKFNAGKVMQDKNCAWAQCVKKWYDDQL